MRRAQAVQKSSRVPVLGTDTYREMKPRLPMGRPGGAEHLAGGNPVANPCGDSRQKRIARANRSTVVEGYGQILRDNSGKRHRTGGRSPDGGAFMRGEVHAPVTCIPGTRGKADRDGCRHGGRDAGPHRGRGKHESESHQQTHRGTVPNVRFAR